MNKKKEKYLIALAGLFHDIGKFYQRVTKNENIDKLFEEELSQGLVSIFSDEELSFIKGEKKEIQYIIQKSLWISPLENQKVEDANLNLQSIFSNLKLKEKSENNKGNYFYKISPLELNESIFPIKEDNLQIDSNSYKNHWDKFKSEFNQKLEDSKLKFNEHPEKIFSLIYHLFYKYLWCIPTSKNTLDVSLFDHARTLSAVACCLYDYDKEDLQQNDLVFLHIKADISGIQKFIYNVYQGKGGVAKILRGRSFYVALLPEILSRYILNELNYPISNLLYCGGGIFEILVSNTEENEKKLNKIIKEIEKFLAEKFEADLGISVAMYKYFPADMLDRYENVLMKLNENLDNAKKSKFKTLIEEGKIFELLNKRTLSIHTNKKKCPVCQTYLIDENLEGDKEICDVCETFWNIGHHLPKTEALVFAKKRTQNFVDNKKIVDFDNFGLVYFISKDNDVDSLPIYLDEKTTEILSINNTQIPKFTTGFKFMGKSVPTATSILKPEETGEEDIVYPGQIVPFTVLSQYSEGDKRIGILRMDVDNLGKLFSSGLGKTNISRIATISRMLDLFFAGYLNIICEKLSKERKSNGKEKINNLFYILYSGGDDLFIVAPWDEAIQIAVEINKNFKRFTCYNPDVTLSAGYIQTKPKFPIRVSADIAGEAEDIAKKKGKNRICILGDVLKWDEMENAKDIAQNWKELIDNNELQRGFIYAIHRLKEQFLKDENSKSKLVFSYKTEGNPMFYPYAHYYIARNIKDKNLREKIAKLLLDKNSELNNKLTFVINYVALKTRK